MDKTITIIRKEWAEVFKNRLVLFTVLFLPLILAVMPLGMLIAFNQSESFSADMADPEIMQFAGQMCAGLDPVDCSLVYMLNLFVLMFMILPVSIPVTIAAYSIVGEKTPRSLEPLLATQITTVELLVATIVPSVIPAHGATRLGFATLSCGGGAPAARGGVGPAEALGLAPRGERARWRVMALDGKRVGDL